MSEHIQNSSNGAQDMGSAVSTCLFIMMSVCVPCISGYHTSAEQDYDWCFVRDHRKELGAEGKWEVGGKGGN